MSTGAIVAIVVVVIVVAAIVVVMAAMNRRHRLQQKFGPEYDRAVTEHGQQAGSRSRARGAGTARA